MKKFLLYLTAFSAVLTLFASCHRDEPEVADEYAVAKVAQADLIDAAAAAYAVWEDETAIPATLSVQGTAITKAGELELTLPQYQYALATLICNLADGKSDEIIVKSYKPADHPDRDSYDKTEVAVTGGPAITEGTEDLADFAKRFIATTEDKGTVPNQTLVTREGESAIAFSTNRLTVCMLRAAAGYKSGKSLPKTVSTEYLSAAATLKGFAQQFVGILDIWENTVGTVSADGSHCTDNGSAWQNVHFVPIPHSGGAYADGVDQYDAKYQPYFTVTIDGVTYTSAQTWGIALRGIVDLITKEGSSVMQQNRNPFEHTMANGASLKEPIPNTIPEDIWGMYPWYESTNDGPAIDQSEFSPYLIARCATWFLARQIDLGKIGNFQYFGTDPDSGFVEEGVTGFVSAMRMWLIAARFYKYLLDNDINDNVYDAVKDVKFSSDLYGVEMPDLELKTKSVSLDMDGTAKNAMFIAKESWTATASESWIHVTPDAGEAANSVSIAISADPNDGDERYGEVILRGGNVTDGLTVSVTQAKYVDPSLISLKTFAEEFVKGLDVWAATVGTVESEGKHLIEKGTAWENVHFIPVGKTGGPYDDHAGNQHDDMYTPWVLNVEGTQYTSAQAWEIAIRGLLDMVLEEGQGYLNTMTSRNKPAYTLADNGSLSETVAVNPSNMAKWGMYPWYEADDTYSGLTYNGEPVTEVGVDLVVKACIGHVVRGLVGIPGAFSALGAIGNYQQFGSTDDTLMLEGYEGLIAPMRELVVLMRIYKYLLDNNIDKNVYSAIKDVKFDYDMYGADTPETPKPTIADFAKEFAKVADKWESTTGSVTVYDNGQERTYDKVHYVPENFTITLNGVSYDKYQQHLIAMHALQALNEGGSLSDNITEPEAYKPSDARYDEFGAPLQEKVARVDMLLNATERLFNYSSGKDGKFPDAFGYPRGDVSLNGTVSVERFYLTLARWFKHVSENNVTGNVVEATKNVDINAELYGEVADTPAVTLGDFAREFVKVLDVWQANVGTIDADGAHCSGNGTAWENVHYIPTKTSTYPDSDNNKGDETTITVGGVSYTMPQCWTIAAQGIINMITLEGTALVPSEQKVRVHTPGNGVGLNAEMPAAKDWNQWVTPWYEYEGDLNLSLQNPPSLEMLAQVLPWWLKRAQTLDSGKGRINNFQILGDYGITGYTGTISAMRMYLIMARFYKHLVDNDITSNVYDAMKGVVIDPDLYGISETPSQKVTIGQFAKEYVKVISIWEENTGTINYLTGEEPGSNYLADVRDAHYVPSSTTLTIGGKTYGMGDVLEIAERSYLLLRGWNGNQTTGGLGTLEEIEKATFDTEMPEPHGSTFGPASYNEFGTTYAGKAYNSNCGPLRMGNPETADGKACSVKMDILDNFAQRHVNWPITHNGVHSNMCGYCERLDGYYGCFSAQRALITYAYFFKYMLDNKYTSTTTIAVSEVFRSENLGGESDDIGAGPNSIQAFANAYVQALNIWYRTTGTINYLTGETLSGNEYNEEFDNKDAHYIPTATTITINGDNKYKKTFTSADLLELGERSYLLLRGWDGNQTTGGKDAFASVSKASMTDDMPETHSTAFGPASFNESGTTSAGNQTTRNGGHLRMGDPNTADGLACSVKLDILDNFAQRHVNWPMTHEGVHSNMCGYSGGQLAGYYGCFSAQRALVTYGFFFENILRNGLKDASSFTASDVFRSEEFGDEK